MRHDRLEPSAFQPAAGAPVARAFRAPPRALAPAQRARHRHQRHPATPSGFRGGGRHRVFHGGTGGARASVLRRVSTWPSCTTPTTRNRLPTRVPCRNSRRPRRASASTRNSSPAPILTGCPSSTPCSSATPPSSITTPTASRGGRPRKAWWSSTIRTPSCKCNNKVYLAELLTRHHIPAPRTLMVHRDNVEQIIPQPRAAVRAQAAGQLVLARRGQGGVGAGIVRTGQRAAAEIRADRRPGISPHRIRLARRHPRPAAAVRVQVLHGRRTLADRQARGRAHGLRGRPGRGRGSGRSAGRGGEASRSRRPT